MGRNVKGEGVNGEVESQTWVVESQGRAAPRSRISLKPYSQFSQLSCSTHSPASSFKHTPSRQAKTMEFLSFSCMSRGGKTELLLKSGL